MLPRLREIVCLLTLLLLAGCSRPTTPDGLREYLDEATAMTVVHLAEPAVYYQDAPMLAAHARDYVSLAPLELSQAGQRRYLLWVWRWSTIDRGPAPGGSEPRIVLFLDDEPMELRTSRPPSLGRWPYAPPVNGGEMSVYALTRNQVERLGRARRLSVYLEDGPAAGDYLPWTDARAGMSAFARRVNARGLPTSTVASFDD